MTKQKLIYLASPYTSHADDPEVREKDRQRRIRMACWTASALIEMGFSVFSPIAHSAMIEHHDRDFPHEVWMRLDIAILSRCDELVVLQLRGWKESKGVREEIEYAELNGIPVRYINPAIACNKLFEKNESASHVDSEA